MIFERKSEFKRNEGLESLLQEINSYLESCEDKILTDYTAPEYPVVFIVGCGRSGSTLMLQWLAKSGKFAYPTNMLSRFYAAPYIGAKIQQMLTNPRFSFRDELDGFTDKIDFASELGKTRGILAPNEFWYFWRRFFPFDEIQYIDDQSLKKIETSKFIAELAAMEAAFAKPLALKALIINWNIPFVAEVVGKAIFLYVKRHPLYCAQSLLESRIKFYGDINHWYSFKPKEYDSLKESDPYTQVAGQVYFTNLAVREGLDKIDSNRTIEIDYQDFCKEPGVVFNVIKRKLTDLDFPAEWSYDGPVNFKNRNILRLSGAEIKRIIAGYKRFSGIDISL